MDGDICTQFICIIRNKRGLESPKIYDVKFEYRDKNYVNFLKDGDAKKGDIKSIISDKNKNIKDLEKKRNPQEYFSLIEADIPFLNDLDNDVSDLFEFMDFPGLDENSNINLFYKDYLPLILPNTIFPIFIFQIGSFEGNNSCDVLSYYQDFSKKFNFPELEKACIESFKKSIFILNKIDLIPSEEDKKKQLTKFREQFDLDEKNSLYCSAQQHLLENNKFNSFYQFIEYIINDESCDFFVFLENKLKNEFNIKNISKLEKADNIYNKIIDKNPKKDGILDKDESDELKKIENLINGKNYIFETFPENKYLFYKNIFLKNIHKKKDFKESDLTLLLKEKIKNIYMDFTDLSKFNITLNKINGKNSKNEKNNFSKYLKDIFKELFEINQNEYNRSQILQIVNGIDELIKKFYPISKNSPRLKKCKEKIDDLIINLNPNEITLKILVFGKYSTGKSSLLNSIIGYNLNILHTSINECTKKAFIIKYCETVGNISLTKCEKKEIN